MSSHVIFEYQENKGACLESILIKDIWLTVMKSDLPCQERLRYLNMVSFPAERKTKMNGTWNVGIGRRSPADWGSKRVKALSWTHASPESVKWSLWHFPIFICRLFLTVIDRLPPILPKLLPKLALIFFWNIVKSRERAKLSYLETFWLWYRPSRAALTCGWTTLSEWPSNLARERS